MNESNNTSELEASTNPAIDYSTCYAQPSIQLFNCDNLQLMAQMEDESVDVILTDPPYKYLKNQKLEREFDEQLLFSECKRVLTKDGFIVLFGRGTSFYRWNYMLSELGFVFKEEFIWDKGYCTSPLMAISRVHESISIFTKKSGTINKVKIPYIEMKSHDINSIIQDVKRIKGALNNTKSLDHMIEFLSTNKVNKVSYNTISTSISSIIEVQDRASSCLNGIKNGLNERTIIRGDWSGKISKNEITADNSSAQSGDRGVNCLQSVAFGLNEKSIIKAVRDHYTSIHPTQKPVRLLERLLALVIPKDKPKEEITVLDPFGGSFSTMEAVYNMGMQGIACEIDKEYYELGKERIEKLPPRQTALFD